MQHLGTVHPVNNLIHNDTSSSSDVNNHRSSPSSYPDFHHAGLSSQILDMQRQLDAMKATLNQQSNSTEGETEMENDVLNDAADAFDLSHCIKSAHVSMSNQHDVKGILQDSTNEKTTIYGNNASSSSSSSYLSESEYTRSPRQYNGLNGLEPTPVNGVAPSAASDLSTALGKYLWIVKNFSLSALRSTPDSSSLITHDEDPPVIVPPVLQISCDVSSDAGTSDSISSDSIAMSQYGSTSMGTILSPDQPMRDATVWGMHSLGSPSAISDDDNSPIPEGKQEITAKSRPNGTYDDMVNVSSPVIEDCSGSIGHQLLTSTTVDDAKENQFYQPNNTSSSQTKKKKNTEKKKKNKFSQ